MNGGSTSIQCGLCGHRHPPERIRPRGFVDCACGLRIELPRPAPRRHRLAGSIVGLFFAAAMGATAYLWARGPG